jgi:hypothetical protein
VINGCDFIRKIEGSVLFEQVCIKVLLCGKNVIYCHFFDKIMRIPSGRIVVPSGRIAVPLMGGFLVLEGKIMNI